MSDSSDTPLAAGTIVAGYRIERLVAEGGMGAVYEATQQRLDRRVALKLISNRLAGDDRFRARFQREARTAAAIDHTNILPVHQADEWNGRPFLAMRFVDGIDLSTLLKREGPLRPTEAIAILTQVADALDAAHAHGLVHRDVKPANVMLERREHHWHAYLTDFGLAKHFDEQDGHTNPGEVLGTVDYMAPEQATGGPLDGRADVYAFGCMLYRCLTGEVPYKRGSPAATLMAHANAPVPLPSERVPGLPAALDDVVERAMTKDPAQRADSAGELMRRAQPQAQTVVSGESPTVASATTSTAPLSPDDESRPAPRGRRLRTQVALAVAAYAPLWTATYLLGRSL